MAIGTVPAELPQFMFLVQVRSQCIAGTRLRLIIITKKLRSHARSTMMILRHTWAIGTLIRAARRNPEGIGLGEIDRLRRAELALAAAPSTEIAARELGKHAMRLLDAPAAVVETALQAANLIGDGFYGVDLKQVGDKVFVIEINDNPNIDHGIEDAAEKDQVWVELTRWFIDRLEA